MVGKPLSTSLAAGQPPKVVSEVLGHSTVAFTMDAISVAEELGRVGHVRHRRLRPAQGQDGGGGMSKIIRRVPAMCQHLAGMAAETKTGTSPAQRSAWSPACGGSGI
jgi:hypothetical protein